MLSHSFIVRFLRLAACAFVFAVLSNCAFGTARISLTHDPLHKPHVKRQGTIMLERFIDERPFDKGGEFIGNKRNGYGAVLGHVAVDSGKVDSILTGFIAEALKNTGYTVIDGTSQTNAATDATSVPVLTGKIKECWMDMYMVANAEISIDVNLLTSDKKESLWKANLNGGKVNLLWWGIKSEFTNVFKGAVNFTLDSAQTKFSSEDFAKKVSK
jgi:hypothetical protein